MPTVFDSALYLLRDVLRTASQVARQDSSATQFTTTTVTLDGEPVSTASGQLLVPDGAAEDAAADILLLPGIAQDGPPSLVTFLDRTEASEAVRWIGKQHARGVEIATACTGTWLVAESGLLDGRQATTTWHLAPAFRQRYPAVNLQQNRMVTFDNSIWTAGAAMAHMDLALAIISTRSGAEVGRHVASLLLLDQRPSQAQYMVTHYLSGANKSYRTVDSWTREHLEEPFTMQTLATETGHSTRTLARRLKEATGETPLAFVQRLRVERAIHLLATTSLSFGEITLRVGYQEPATLRRLIRRQTGRSPSDLRL